MEELTICSVYHSDASRKLLELNRELTDALNPQSHLSWLVTDNAPPDLARRIDPRKFNVVAGLPLVDFIETLPPHLRRIAPMSRHHAYAIHLLLQRATTRFVLVLDSDFYIVMPRWITRILTHMKKGNVALLGVPWHPRWWKKVRYFPAHHALFLDAAQIPLKELDFSPQYTDEEELPKRRSFGISLFNMLHARTLIGTSKDTSYKIYEQYKNSSHIVEAMRPVFNFPHEPNMPKRILKRIARYIVPDRFSFTPRSGTYSLTSFRECGLFDARSRGWEEFMWRNEPFGFHMRRTSVGAAQNVARDIDTIESFVQDMRSQQI